MNARSGFHNVTIITINNTPDVLMIRYDRRSVIPDFCRCSGSSIKQSADSGTPRRRLRGAQRAGDPELQGGGRPYPHHLVVPWRTASNDRWRQPRITSHVAADRSAVLPTCGTVWDQFTALRWWDVLLQSDQPGDWRQRSQQRSFALSCRSVAITYNTSSMWLK